MEEEKKRRRRRRRRKRRNEKLGFFLLVRSLTSPPLPRLPAFLSSWFERIDMCSCCIPLADSSFSQKKGFEKRKNKKISSLSLSPFSRRSLSPYGSLHSSSSGLAPSKAQPLHL